MNRENNIFDFDVIITIIYVILVMIVMSGVVVLIIEKTHLRPQSSTMMVMEVQDKTYKTTQVIQSVKPVSYRIEYTYYLMDDDIKIEVSRKVYNDTNIGDKICILKTEYIDNRTNEIAEIKYTYAN